MELKKLIYTVEDGIAVITMNYLKNLNAIDEQMADELIYVFDEAEKDPNVKVVVLKGSDRAFSAGGDIGYFYQLIQAGGRYTLYDDNLMMTGDDLFKEGDSFSPSLYTDFLPNGKWNGGSDVNFEFHIDSLTPEKATISFTKIA